MVFTKLSSPIVLFIIFSSVLCVCVCTDDSLLLFAFQTNKNNMLCGPRGQETEKIEGNLCYFYLCAYYPAISMELLYRISHSKLESEMKMNEWEANGANCVIYTEQIYIWIRAKRRRKKWHRERENCIYILFRYDKGILKSALNRCARRTIYV